MAEVTELDTTALETETAQAISTEKDENEQVSEQLAAAAQLDSTVPTPEPSATLAKEDDEEKETANADVKEKKEESMLEIDSTNNQTQQPTNITDVEALDALVDAFVKTPASNVTDGITSKFKGDSSTPQASGDESTAGIESAINPTPQPSSGKASREEEDTNEETNGQNQDTTAESQLETNAGLDSITAPTSAPACEAENELGADAAMDKSPSPSLDTSSLSSLVEGVEVEQTATAVAAAA